MGLRSIKFETYGEGTLAPHDTGASGGDFRARRLALRLMAGLKTLCTKHTCCSANAKYGSSSSIDSDDDPRLAPERAATLVDLGFGQGQVST